MSMFSGRIRTLAGWFLVGSTFFLSGTAAWAVGVIYYNQIPTFNSPALLRRVNSDGTADQPIPLNLPAALNPTVSRNGRVLLVTSADPGRPFKVSLNVYAIDLLTGFTGRATSYEDEYVSGGVRFQTELQRLFGNNTVSSYKVNYPFHKALSPDGTRVVVMNLFKSGSITLGSALDGNEVQASSGRFPILDVYNLADALPTGSYLYLSPQDRDGLNQGGDGIDWHPALNEVVGAVASDIPASGNAAGNGLEGTVLAVFSAGFPSGLVRKLTSPVGERNGFSDTSGFFVSATAPHDYAPSISADGTRVAYVRHFLRQDTRFDGAGIAPLPAICSLRVVNYDGSGDHEILRLNEGLWVTRVAWSPDGTQIAFDLAPQQVLNGWNSMLGDPTRSSINIVNANGSDPHLLVAAPASSPAWAPALAAPVRPILRFVPTPPTFSLEVDGLAAGTAFVVEGSTSITANAWQQLGNFTAVGPAHFITITPNASARFAFYRVKLQ